MSTKILNVLCIIAGLAFLVFGANKLFDFMPKPENLSQEELEAFGALMKLKWLMPLIGVAEIAGGILLAIPRTRIVGALVLLPIIVGIILHNATFSPKSIILGLVFAGIIAWVFVANKQKLVNLLN